MKKNIEFGYMVNPATGETIQEEPSMAAIALKEGLECVDTTDSITGYPSHLKDAITGFKTEDDARIIADKYGLELIWIDRRDGWHLWHRGNPFFKAVDLDPEDVGAVGFLTSEDDVLDIVNERLSDGIGSSDDIQRLQEFLRKAEDAVNDISVLDDDEALLLLDGSSFGDVMKVCGVMNWYYDTKHYAVAAIDIEE